MALLQTALECCRRPEELFQAAGLLAKICIQALHSPKEAIKIYLMITLYYISLRAMLLGERPRTHLMLLAPQPVLVEMTYNE